MGHCHANGIGHHVARREPLLTTVNLIFNIIVQNYSEMEMKKLNQKNAIHGIKLSFVLLECVQLEGSLLPAGQTTTVNLTELTGQDFERSNRKDQRIGMAGGCVTMINASLMDT